MKTSPAAKPPRLSMVRSFQKEEDNYRWTEVPVLDYKPAGSHFKGISRHVLFGEAEDLVCELRYFEIEPGGHSTLERHVHVHAVMILRGEGRVLVDDAVFSVKPFDLVHVPPMTWHQFRAASSSSLGFLCLVPCDRDRPQRTTPQDLDTLRKNPVLDAFLRV